MCEGVVWLADGERRAEVYLHKYIHSHICMYIYARYNCNNNFYFYRFFCCYFCSVFVCTNSAHTQTYLCAYIDICMCIKIPANIVLGLRRRTPLSEIKISLNIFHLHFIRYTQRPEFARDLVHIEFSGDSYKIFMQRKIRVSHISLDKWLFKFMIFIIYDFIS